MGKPEDVDREDSSVLAGERSRLKDWWAVNDPVA
jgi:hypothetical protein